jgi:hypothetical protein
MEPQQIKEITLAELPGIMARDPEVRDFILRLGQDHFADKVQTEGRFEQMLAEIQRDREEQTRRWEEQNAKWEEQNQKWHENQAVLNRVWQSIEALAHKYDATIGALGARGGLQSEQTFRNALKGILEQSLDVEVLHVVEYDDGGEVFGRPDQVEFDLIIRNGQLILCEIKSSMSKADMYSFWKKIRFYERRHGRTADRRVVISPVVDTRARAVARDLGLEVYSYADDVPGL